ncbi:hypothetical protein HGM15179_002607 [Zosterops borbonicus]|uniref:Uncharacterized protein n=1 Tax=Zosterops borbonicus TaxID=364589 RepID=A0A8K1GW17_9PASS|nr:hypothetical protein HGM15179_002607 [Zosterops borbonicus]
MAGGVASVKRYWQVSLRQAEAMPVGSKMDPTWAKAEPISDSGAALGVTFLSEREKNCSTGRIAAKERTKECVRGKPLQTPRSVQKQEEEVFQPSEVRSSAVHGAAHGEAAVSLQYMEVCSGLENHLQPLEDPVSEEDAQRRL